MPGSPFQASGYSEVTRRFADRMVRAQRARDGIVREEAIRLAGILREEAPKRTSVYANGIRARFDSSDLRLTRADVVSTGKHAFLTDIILYGSKGHEIPIGGSAAQLAKGYPLRFYWEDGPKGPGIYYYWSVWHPGTKPNNFLRRGVNRWLPQAREALRYAGLSITDVDYDRRTLVTNRT